MKVVVLAGGVSGEREVSLRSGEQVLNALRSLGHDAEMVDFGPECGEALRRIDPDLVFPTLHGPLGEDGTAAAVLELLDLPYVGSGVLAGALAMNKAAAKRVMIAEGLPTPEFELVESVADPRVQAGNLAAHLGLPLAIKPNSGGSSLGFSIAQDEDAVLDGVALALDSSGPDGAALVESFKPGMEVTIGVLGVLDPQALPTLEILATSGTYDYEAKYTAGMSQHVIPARIPAAQAEEAQRLALRAHHLVGARGLSRVDVICPPTGEVWILEVNTMPGMTELSLFPDAARAAGLEFPALIARLVEEALPA
ncbi:MAG TPA: D-alanine--D-alanine ligase [Candidatus Dormibacteraeota bacterium]|nr:D-alanine--D-alanine ligase [Candidatus Dormibacteraeota bacterium]